MATDLTEQAVLEFLAKRGVVKHKDLIDHFESLWEIDPSKKTPFRDRLNHHVDNLAFVKMEGGMKLVCLNESSTKSSVMRTQPGDGDEECIRKCVCDGDSTGQRDESGSVYRDDNGISSAKCDLSENDSETPDTTSSFDNASESESNCRDACRPVVAVLTDDKASDRISGGEVKLRDRRRRESAPALGTDSVILAGHVQIRGGRRTSRGSQRALLSSALSEDAGWEGLDLDANTPKGSRRNFIELMMSSSPQVRRSLINRGSRPRDSVRSDGDSTSLVSSADGDCVSITLDPLEHEWMLCASEGQWDRLYPLLILEPSLLVKRDFVTGFSCLHWAAKQGKEELLTQLLEHAKRTNVPVDVNMRSSAGYTALHLAAMHRHTQVVNVLVDEWAADPEARDYSGRRAVQYLPPGVSVTATLEHGGGTSPVGVGESDTENANSGAQGGRWRLPRVLQSTLNPLRLLNGPEETGERGVAGRSKAFQRKSSLSRINIRLNRGRHKTQIIHSTSFRGTGDVGEEGEERESGGSSPISPLKPRPMSSLFG